MRLDLAAPYNAGTQSESAFSPERGEHSYLLSKKAPRKVLPSSLVSLLSISSRSDCFRLLLFFFSFVARTSRFQANLPQARRDCVLASGLSPLEAPSFPSFFVHEPSFFRFGRKDSSASSTIRYSCRAVHRPALRVKLSGSKRVEHFLYSSTAVEWSSSRRPAPSQIVVTVTRARAGHRCPQC